MRPIRRRPKLSLHHPGLRIYLINLPRGRHRPALTAEIQEALEESTVPYRVEVVDIASADPAFRERYAQAVVRGIQAYFRR